MENTWTIIRAEAAAHAAREPALRDFLHDAVLVHAGGEAALAHWLALRLSPPQPGDATLRALIGAAFAADRELLRTSERDLLAIRERDPACESLCAAFLFYKGFHALQIHRAAHWHWHQGRRFAARLLQHCSAEALGIDIHPGARMGAGVLLDHGTGFVAGETAVVGDNVNLLHGVTLGGTGKQAGDRHPKIAADVSIGAGAVILGNIEIGRGARVGAGAVVLKPVPCAGTAVGARARVVERDAPVAAPTSECAAQS